jgi:HK97 family phage portal protein
LWPFKKREEQRAITEWPWDVGGSVPGANIGVDRALSLVPVFGAARLLADTVASLTPVLYTKGKDGIQRQLPTPSLFTQPSVHGTLYDWLHRGTTSMALQGDAIGLVTQRDYYGFPTMVEWLHPEQVATQDGNLSGVGSYINPVWQWNGRRMDQRDVVHIPWFTMPWKVRGLSPIGAFRVAANVGLGAQDYAAEWFNNGGVPPGTFRNSQQRVSKEDSDLITARVTSRLRQRKPLVYGNDWEYTPIAIKPNEAQFIETARLTATHIAVIYGIPPEKIGGSTGSTLTYSTTELNTLDYLVFSARPWLVRWELALNRLFPRGQFVKFETSEMLRTDAKTRAEVDQISLAKQPYKTVDEVRADRDLSPMPKPDPLPDPSTNGAATNGQQQEVKSKPRSGADAIVYLRSRIKDDSSPILKPPPVANGANPLAVGRN